MITKRLAGSACILGIFASPAIADQFDRHVTVINSKRTIVTEIHATNVDRIGWNGPNLLEQTVGTLEPKDSTSLDFNDGTGYCRFNVMINFFDDTPPLVIANMDVCRLNTVINIQ